LAADDIVRVPFNEIAPCLSKEILLLVNPGVGGDFEFSATRLAPQLALGQAKATFSELRAAAPAGLFRGSPATGDLEFALPLAALVPRMPKAKLGRISPRKRWDAPAEVGNLFGPKGTPLKKAEAFFAAPPAASEPAAPAPAPIPAPAPRPVATAPAPAVPTTPSAPPVSAPVAEPAAASLIPGSDVLAVPLAQLAALWPAPVIGEIRQLVLGGKTVHLPASQIEPVLRSGKVAFTWQQIAAWIHPEPVAVSPATAGTLVELPLKVVAPLFVARFRAKEGQKRVKVGDDIPDVFGNRSAVPKPEPIAPVVEAVAAPVPPVAPAPAPEPPAPEPVPLAALQPPVEAAPPAPVEPAPLPVQEPIRMPKLTLAEPPKAPVPQPVAPEPIPVPAASRLGALFGNPQKAEWSPAEIVQKVAVFPGVTGAVIALPEGLPVAAQLPSSVNADAFAGFMPQMFARIAQYTRELKFGEIHKLSLEVNSGHVTVFRAGRVYFGVIGEGATAPAAQLALVAGELSKLNP
jgi:predicted regulator of Ras-like GTPase activity (Roadblock/LC7/MglB family)